MVSSTTRLAVWPGQNVPVRQQPHLPMPNCWRRNKAPRPTPPRGRLAAVSPQGTGQPPVDDIRSPSLSPDCLGRAKKLESGRALWAERCDRREAGRSVLATCRWQSSRLPQGGIGRVYTGDCVLLDERIGHQCGWGATCIFTENFILNGSIYTVDSP